MNVRGEKAFFAASLVLIVGLAAFVAGAGHYDPLLLTTIFPVVWGAYRFRRRTYLALHVVSTAASTVAVCFIFFPDPSTSLETVGVTAITLLFLCEAIHRMVAKRNELEKKLKESEMRLNQIASNLGEMVWLGDERHFLYLSPAHKKIWGREWSSFPVKRQELLDFVVEEDRAAVERFRMAQFKEAEEIEYRIQRADGATRFIRERAFPIARKEGESERVAGVAEDITEQLAIEEELRQAKKMEVLGRLAASVAHDFNNVLTVIHGYSFLLKTDLELNEQQNNAVNEIKSAVEKGHALTKRLLGFTRNQKPERKVCDLNEIVKGLVGMIVGLVDRSISIKLQTSAEPLPVNVDRAMIEQALLNLVINSRDAMPEGGAITFVTGAYVEGENEMQRFATVAVADTGVGMSAEIQKRLFEPFFTTKAMGKGTGLGLPAVERIVKDHRGRVVVSSEEGGGSTFSLVLPLSRREVEPSAVRNSDAEVYVVERGTVLLVEDDPQIRAVSKQTLSGCGYRVLECRSGVSALQTWRDGKDSICLVITDVTLADGFSGIELARELQESNNPIPVIFTGNCLPPVSSEWVFESEALAKPYDQGELLKAVRRLLKQRPERKQSEVSSG